MTMTYSEALRRLDLMKSECPHLWRSLIDEPMRVALRFNRVGITAFHTAAPSPEHAARGTYTMAFGGEA